MPNMLSYVVLFLGSLALAFLARRRFYPKPYAGIPYNQHSANRLTGDVPDLTPIIKATNEYSSPLMAVTTQRLRRPLAQLLFPALRPPLLILDDPREIEDVLVRRGREFDRAPVSMHIVRHYFRHAMMTQYSSSPGLRDQKRVWADAFGADFLRRVAAPSVYQAALDLLNLWGFKADGGPFRVVEDFHNTTFDAMWVALTGEKAGIVRHEIEKLQQQQQSQSLTGGGGDGGGREHPIGSSPRGNLIKGEVEYVNAMIAKGFGSIGLSRLAQMFRAYMPRHRQFRKTVDTEVGLVIGKAVDRFQRLEAGDWEAGEGDTCMMDMVLRRKILEARKSGRPLTDPAKDKVLVDDTFMMILAVCGMFSWQTTLRVSRVVKGVSTNRFPFRVGLRYHGRLSGMVRKIHGVLPLGPGRAPRGSPGCLPPHEEAVHGRDARDRHPLPRRRL